MAIQSVTVQLPEPLYEQLEKRAEQARRSVADEIVELVATALSLDEQLPQDLADASPFRSRAGGT